MTSRYQIWFSILSITAIFFGSLFPLTQTYSDESKTPAGFTPIFNGKDLTGWRGREHVDPAEMQKLPEAERSLRQQKSDKSFQKHWRVVDGVLFNDGHGAYCTTKEDYSDFELLLDWKMIEAATDSGVYIRGCPQIQLWDPNNVEQHKYGCQLGSGGLWDNDKGSPGKDPLVKADMPVGQWNTMRIRIVDDRVTVQLNGQVVVDDSVMQNSWNRKEKLYRSGPIQLQTHGGGEMRFRRIFIRKL